MGTSIVNLMWIKCSSPFLSQVRGNIQEQWLHVPEAILHHLTVTSSPPHNGITSGLAVYIWSLAVFSLNLRSLDKGNSALSKGLAAQCFSSPYMKLKVSVGEGTEEMKETNMGQASGQCKQYPRRVVFFPHRVQSSRSVSCQTRLFHHFFQLSSVIISRTNFSPWLRDSDLSLLLDDLGQWDIYAWRDDDVAFPHTNVEVKHHYVGICFYRFSNLSTLIIPWYVREWRWVKKTWICRQKKKKKKKGVLQIV